MAVFMDVINVSDQPISHTLTACICRKKHVVAYDSINTEFQKGSLGERKPLLLITKQNYTDVEIIKGPAVARWVKDIKDTSQQNKCNVRAKKADELAILCILWAPWRQL